MVIESPRNETEHWLMETVSRQSQQVGIGMPTVAIHDHQDINAFATGAKRDDSLVAVSTGPLHNMTRDEAEAVLAHEVSHIANGDSGDHDVNARCRTRSLSSYLVSSLTLLRRMTTKKKVSSNMMQYWCVYGVGIGIWFPSKLHMMWYAVVSSMLMQAAHLQVKRRHRSVRASKSEPRATIRRFYDGVWYQR